MPNINYNSTDGIGSYSITSNAASKDDLKKVQDDAFSYSKYLRDVQKEEFDRKIFDIKENLDDDNIRIQKLNKLINIAFWIIVVLFITNFFTVLFCIYMAKLWRFI